MTTPLTYERLAELRRLARGDRGPAPGEAVSAHTVSSLNVSEALPATVSVDHLLSQALRSENGRTRALAEKIHTLAADLAQRVQDEYQTRRHRIDAEVTALEQQLAEARARLHSLDSDATPPTAHTSPTTTPARRAGAKSGVDAAAVRAWAADHGYQVKPLGRIPANIIDAWRDATINATPSFNI
ncbi:Lsr2 family DNA-binding protein [Micromonospora rubida]